MIIRVLKKVNPYFVKTYSFFAASSSRPPGFCALPISFSITLPSKAHYKKIPYTELLWKVFFAIITYYYPLIFF